MNLGVGTGAGGREGEGRHASPMPHEAAGRLRQTHRQFFARMWRRA